jgi:hypothetical protein
MKKIYLKLFTLIVIPFCLSAQTANRAVNAVPTLSFNTTASKLVDLSSGKISCVMNNATDPFIVNGLDINVGDEDLSTVAFSMTSSKTTVVPNANFTVTGTGAARKFKITPIGVGYATITLKVRLLLLQPKIFTILV